jgi:hypothetical protein
VIILAVTITVAGGSVAGTSVIAGASVVGWRARGVHADRCGVGSAGTIAIRGAIGRVRR